MLFSSTIARYKKNFSQIVIGFIGGIAVGLIVGVVFSNPTELQNERDKYPLLANRLFAVERDELIINFTPLREVMREQFNKIDYEMGVYFEYLPTGVSVGVNDQFEVEIASLAKVPAVMGVYRQIESGQLDPAQILTVQQDNLDDLYGNLWQRGVGTQLTLEEAVSLTLQQSDNTAANTLVSQLPEGALQEVFNALDLPRQQTGPFPVLSPKSYASVLRSLYLASFVNKQHSNHILELLTKSDFTDKLPAGLPKGVKIAHKIGVFKSEGNDEIFSDCGIIFEPNRPYILCIMSATDEATARKDMQLFSRMIYSYVSQVENAKQN